MTYTIHEKFITDQPAPIPSPHLCEPGPGQLTLEGTTYSILGGELIVPAGDIPSGGSGFWALPTISHIAGNAIHATITPTNNGVHVVSWRDAAKIGYSSILGRAMLMSANKLAAINAGANAAPMGFGYTVNQTYEMMVIIRYGGGNFGLVKGGTEYPDWHLAWVSDQGLDGSQTAGYFNETGAGRMSDFDVFWIGGDWATQYGVAHSIMASPATGNTTKVPADTILEVSWVPDAGQVFEWFVRHVDDNNTLIIRVNQATKIVQLWKREAGVETLLDSDPANPAGVFPFVVGQPYKILATLRGSLLNTAVFDVTANLEGARNSTTNTFNQSATGAKIPTALNWSNHIAWPIHVGSLVLDGMFC